MDNLVDIIQSIIDQIDLDIKVKNVDVDKIFVCRTTLHLTNTKVVIIDGKEYTVIDFELNKWVQVKPKGHTDPVPVDVTIITAPKITFLHGAPYSANNEYLQLSPRTLNKTPFIWLVEGYEFEDLPRDSSIEAAFDAHLLFLDWAGENKWLNEEHNEKNIKPMNNLKNEFIDVINNDFNFKSLGSVKSISRTRFGVQVTDGKGNTNPKKKIIDEDLSGVESKMKIEVFDVSSCTCN